MLNKILMPSGGQTTDEMMILNWNKQVGDFVKRGDILFEIETDKAILTVESFAEGVLLDIKYPAGEMVKVGEVVALIGEKADVEKVDQKDSMPNNIIAVPTVQQNEIVCKDIIEEKDISVISASPLARKIAAAENITLKDIFEKTQGKTIKKADVEQFLLQRKANSTGTSFADFEPTKVEDDYTVMNVLPIRKTIARRMAESLSVAPHYVISIEVDMSAAISLRERFNANIDKTDNKISYNDILMKVIAAAVRAFPLVNSSYSGDQIKVFKDVHIGLAVATDTGIVVPVVREVNKKNIVEIAQQNTANIQKVRVNQLQESDLRGGTITISNLGMFGIHQFTAIINQPESCILAVGAIIRKPVAAIDNNDIVIRPIMTITGSFDHRIIDGAIGAPFLQKVKQLLEEPSLLL
ncbi:MAG: dihydrolipoamide acetyltransferase family protein [Agriterribacter sp.]